MLPFSTRLSTVTNLALFTETLSPKIFCSLRETHRCPSSRYQTSVLRVSSTTRPWQQRRVAHPATWRPRFWNKNPTETLATSGAWELFYSFFFLVLHPSTTKTTLHSSRRLNDAIITSTLLPGSLYRPVPKTSSQNCSLPVLKPG